MAEDVEAGGGVDLARHRARVERIADAESRAEVAVGDAGLGTAARQVEDGGSGRFGAGACRCWDGDERVERARDGLTLAEWCVDKVEEVGVCGNEVIRRNFYLSRLLCSDPVRKIDSLLCF